LRCERQLLFRVSDDGPSRRCGEAPGPSSESLQGRNPREVNHWCRTHYGDFGAAPGDVAAADVAWGVIVRQRGAVDAAPDARQWELDADLNFAGLAG
jgi:hypothetical protein